MIKNIILASASPRRLALLRDRGYEVTVVPSDFDESAVAVCQPQQYVMSLAEGKGKCVAQRYPCDTVIAADTVVVLDGNILGKPRDRDDAVAMLSALSDNTHSVYTGVCIIKNGQTRVFCDEAQVTFHPLTSAQIEKYVDSGSPFDKAGAYGIQDDAGIGFVRSLTGELSCVIGLPVGRIIEQLEK